MTDDLAKRIKDLLGVKSQAPKREYKFAPGYTRCQDCRCRGNGECKGESQATRDAWRRMMEDMSNGR